MSTSSFTRLLLAHWGVSVKDIPTSDLEQKKEADFIASFGESTVLIEEKTKEDDPEYLNLRAIELERGDIHSATLPMIRNETISKIVSSASRQLKSSSNLSHDFKLMWFTATGVTAQAKYEQFMATLYGRTNILEMNADGFRRCYYFRYADFFRRALVIDGAVAAYTDGRSISAKLCLNPLSPRYESLKNSDVIKFFGTAVEDPIELEQAGTAFILDCDLSRKDEAPLLEYLRLKYKTAPLMNFDMGHTNISMLFPKD